MQYLCYRSTTIIAAKKECLKSPNTAEFNINEAENQKKTDKKRLVPAFSWPFVLYVPIVGAIEKLS
jgi:hypothetical protein